MTEDMQIINKLLLTHGGMTDERNVKSVENYQHFLMVHHGITADEAFTPALMVCSGVACDSDTNWVAMYALLHGKELDVEVIGMLYDMIHRQTIERTEEPSEYMYIMAQCINDRACAAYALKSYMPDDLHGKYFLDVLRRYDTVTGGTVAAYLVYGLDVACSVVQIGGGGIDKVIRMVKNKYV